MCRKQKKSQRLKPLKVSKRALRRPQPELCLHSCVQPLRRDSLLFAGEAEVALETKVVQRVVQNLETQAGGGDAAPRHPLHAAVASEARASVLATSSAHRPTICASMAARAGNAVPYTCACIDAAEWVPPTCGAYQVVKLFAVTNTRPRLDCSHRVNKLRVRLERRKAVAQRVVWRCKQRKRGSVHRRHRETSCGRQGSKHKNTITSDTLPTATGGARTKGMGQNSESLRKVGGGRGGVMGCGVKAAKSAFQATFWTVLSLGG